MAEKIAQRETNAWKEEREVSRGGKAKTILASFSKF